MKPPFLVYCFVLAGVPAFAQHPQNTGLAGTFGNTSMPSPGINTGGSNPSSTIGPSSSSIYLYGRVVMSDGSELPLNVVIEKTCNGRTTALTYADRKGRFTVSLSGDSTAKYADASYDSRSAGSPNQGAAVQTVRKPSLVGCELRASYPGFHSDHLNITSSRAMDSSDLGDFLLHKDGGSEASTVSVTFLHAPKDAMRAYQKGMDSLRKGRTEIASEQFRNAARLYDNFASAWYELGRLKMTQDEAAAKKDLEKAVAVDPKYAPPYVELAFLAVRVHDWRKTVELASRVIALNSASFPQVFYYSAVANVNLENYDEAEKKAREAVRLDHDRRFPKAMQLLGFLLERKGDLPGAREQMRGYLETAPAAADEQVTKTELAALESRLSVRPK